MLPIVRARTAQSSAVTRPTRPARAAGRSRPRAPRGAARTGCATSRAPAAASPDPAAVPAAAPAVARARSLLPPGDEVREQPVRAGHARGQLPEEREARVHVRALPVLR